MIHKKYFYYFIFFCCSSGQLYSSANDWVCTEYIFNQSSNRIEAITTPAITDPISTEDHSASSSLCDTNHTQEQNSFLEEIQRFYSDALSTNRATSAKRQRNDAPKDRPNRRSRTNNTLEFMLPITIPSHTTLSKLNPNLTEKILNKEELNVDRESTISSIFFNKEKKKVATLPFIEYPSTSSTNKPSTRQYVKILPSSSPTYSIQTVAPQTKTGANNFIPLPITTNTKPSECIEKLPAFSSIIPTYRPQTFDSTHDLPLVPAESLFDSIQVLPAFSHLKPLGHILPRCSSLLSALNQHKKT